jgi:gliding motility-associated-like protein
MKKKRLIALFFLLTSCTLQAQTPFQKSLPENMDTAFIRSAPDGQSVYVVGNKGSRVYIIRLNSSGNMLWQREYSGGGSTAVKSLETVSDGVYVLLGANPSPKVANGYLMKLKTDGTVAWSRQIGEKNLTNVIEIKKDGADNIWLTAEHLSRTPTDSAYSFLSQFNNNGAIIYNRKNVYHFFFNIEDEVCKVTDLIWNPDFSSMIMVEDFEAPYAVSHISGPNRGRHTLRSHSNGQYGLWFMGFHFSKLARTKQSISASGWTIKVGDLSKDIPAICLLDNRGRNFLHIKTTKNVMQPIHSQNGDIVFYEPVDKILTKYDTSLTAIWTKKYDNCYETKAFMADVAVDGSIYTVRNIKDKTVVSRILPTGSLSVCVDYDKPPVPVPEFRNFFEVNGSFEPVGLYELSFLSTDTLLNFNITTPATADNCFKLDAEFKLPDTICLGQSLKPENVDTSADLKHEWFILSRWDENTQPKIDFPSVGTYRIYHSLRNTFCTDTVSHFVTVVLPPKITLSDTIVCGFPKISVNLTDNNANRYFLNGVATPPIFDIKQNGNYAIRVENAGCRAEKNVKIKLVDFPSPLKPVDSILCQGVAFPVVLTGSFEQIFWDNKAVLDTFIIKDGSKHSYRATYSLDKDCIIKGEFTVTRKSCGGASIPDILFVPTAFSPNGDTANEVFQAYPSKDAEILSMMIYNRWGNLVFQSVDGTEGWNGLIDGKIAAPDVFVYWVKYKDKRTDKVLILSGDVLLVK